MDKMKRIGLLIECGKISRNKSGLITKQDIKLITEAEYREFENIFQRWLRNGVAGAATGAAAALGGAAVGQKMGFKGGGQKVMAYLGAILSIPFGLFFSRLYKLNTDKCVQSCGKDRLCYYKCYLDACDANIDRIQKDINEVSNMMENNPQEIKVHQKLLTQLRFYQQKRFYFLKRLQKVAPKYEKYKEPSPDVDVY